MGIFRQFPYSNFHELNLDWLLNSMKELKSEWGKFLVNWGKEVSAEVDKWLTEHPEATTTVDFRIATKVFDTVADMQDDTTLEIGDNVRTNGYYALNDDGGAIYQVSDTSEYIGSVLLDNGLYANLVDRERVNALSLGFVRDGVTDNHNKMLEILAIKNTADYEKAQMTLVFPHGMYAFSPTKIKAWGFVIEGEGNPYASNSRFLSTVFCPVSDQNYIIMMGDDDTQLFMGGPMFVNNGIKNIQFSCNKPNTPSRSGTAYNYQVHNALIINRQYMSQFYDIAFFYCYGTGLKMASSYECLFTTLMFRNILAPEKGAFCFGTDFMNDVVTSDTSSNYFDNIEFEAIAGPYANFEKDCNVENNVFNSIIVEDYRLDMPQRVEDDPLSSWGTTWTSNTWLPAGVTEPDVELGIFNFEEGAFYSNNTIGNITASMYAVRSYYLDNVLYTHDAIVTCSGFPRRLDFQCSVLNVQYNRTDVKTLIYDFPWTPLDFNFTIANAILNDNSYDMILDGVCRNYFVTDNRLRRPTVIPYGYIEAYKYAVASGVGKNIINTAIDGETVYCYSPIGKGTKESYTRDGVSALVPDRTVYSNAGNMGPVRIPIIGSTLNIRIYQEASNRVIYAIYDKNGTQLSVGNFSSAPSGWSWVSVNTSSYIADGNYITLFNRDDGTPDTGNLVDVIYWS